MRVFRGQNLDELGSNAGALFENERVSRPGSGHFFGAALSCCCWCGSNFRVALEKKIGLAFQASLVQKLALSLNKEWYYIVVRKQGSSFFLIRL